MHFSLLVVAPALCLLTHCAPCWFHSDFTIVPFHSILVLVQAPGHGATSFFGMMRSTYSPGLRALEYAFD
jgi:hypothetical protein